MTHAQDLACLSAHCFGKQVGGAAPLPQTSEERHPKRHSAEPHDGASRVEGRLRATGPWRAFVHVRSAGQKLTPEHSAALSQQYHALTESERQFFEELADLALVATRQADLPFGRRVRRKVSPQALAHGVPVDAIGALGGGAGDSSLVAHPAPQALVDALAAKNDTKAELASELGEERRAAEVLDSGGPWVQIDPPPPPGR